MAYGTRAPKVFKSLDHLMDVLDEHRETDEANIEALSRMLYKNSDCGMFAEAPSKQDRVRGIDLVIGSIVEGSEVIFTERLSFPLAIDAWDAACGRIENQAEGAYKMAHPEEY